MVLHSSRHSLIAAASEASNEPLKKRFNVEKLPAIRFVSEKTKVVYSFEGAENAEEVVQFVQTSISPALRNLAELAKKFLAASDKKSLLAEAKKVTATLGANDAECVSLVFDAPSLTLLSLASVRCTSLRWSASSRRATPTSALRCVADTYSTFADLWLFA